MTKREIIIRALKDAPTEWGIIKMSVDFRDEIVKVLESCPERIILRLNNWVRPKDEEIMRIKADVTAQLENGDRVILIPNICEAVFVPEGLEVQVNYEEKR